MHSIRSKTAVFTICAIVVAILTATAIGVIALRNIGIANSQQTLSLMCETGQKNLDAYFHSVEQSVEVVADFATEDLNSLPDLNDETLEGHIDRVESIFEKVAKNTNGVLTYYYRIDPSISTEEVGFWYTDLDGNGFVSHTPTDISLYDTSDTSRLVWFTVPKNTGKSIWLPPYVTDNLNVRVLSYNIPVYRGDTFVGVVGIEIDYSVMAEQVNNINLYQHGYAFINDAEGTIIYHPYIDLEELVNNHPTVPDGLLSEDQYVTYSYEGTEKQAVWKPLENGMRLNVSVPVSEINADWHELVKTILLVSLGLIVVFVMLSLRLTKRITDPMRELVDMAEQVDNGNYDVQCPYDEDNEVGLLSRTFNRLVGHLKTHINDLNDLAYADALTSVRNKGAYNIHVRELQARIDDHDDHFEFAIGIFDCDNLKTINDQYGHDKGDIYLKEACRVICRVFQHSPVFRIGGDEFAVILLHEDFENRDALIEMFVKEANECCAAAENPWEEVHVSMGVAVFDPESDEHVDDVSRRADKLMYENKRNRKAGR